MANVLQRKFWLSVALKRTIELYRQSSCMHHRALPLKQEKEEEEDLLNYYKLS